MPIISDKPQNSRVINVISQNKIVMDTLPQNQGLRDTTTTYFDSRTINVGEPMGLLLAITYPATFSFLAQRI